MAETFLDRLINERSELAEKIEKLQQFINTKNFGDLSLANRLLLEKQVIHMKEYLDILSIRIELIKL